jgi:hypothetical protein
MLKSVEWSPYDKMRSTFIGFSDASGIGMGIYFLGKYASFQCALPANGPKDFIFFYEALAICSVFHLGANYRCDQVVIYSNNGCQHVLISSYQPYLQLHPDLCGGLYCQHIHHSRGIFCSGEPEYHCQCPFKIPLCQSFAAGTKVEDLAF